MERLGDQRQSWEQENSILTYRHWTNSIKICQISHRFRTTCTVASGMVHVPDKPRRVDHPYVYPTLKIETTIIRDFKPTYLQTEHCIFLNNEALLD